MEAGVVVPASSSKKYNGVHEHHISTIFMSGLLLDEHDTILRELWTWPEEVHKEDWSFVGLTGAFLSAMPVMKLIAPNINLAIPSLIGVPMGLYSMYLGLQYYQKEKYKVQFEEFVDLLKKQSKLNKDIVDYYKQRNLDLRAINPDTRAMIDKTFSSRTNKFLLESTNRLENLVLKFLENLLAVKDLTELRHLDYVFNLDLDIANFVTDINNSAQVLLYFQRLELAFVLLSSSFLCGIGVTLSSNKWHKINPQFPKLFEIILPDCLKKIQSEYPIIQKEFTVIQGLLSDMVHPKPKYECSPNKQMLNSLFTFMNSTQITFEVAKALHCQINETDIANRDALVTTFDELEKLFRDCSVALARVEYSIRGSRVRREARRLALTDSGTSRSEYLTTNSTRSLFYESNEPTTSLETPQPNERGEIEYNLTVDGTDVELTDEVPSRDEYEYLVDSLRTQKFLIKELNEELKRRSLVTQEEVPVRQEVPTAVIPPTQRPDNIPFEGDQQQVQPNLPYQTYGTHVHYDELQSMPSHLLALTRVVQPYTVGYSQGYQAVPVVIGSTPYVQQQQGYPYVAMPQAYIQQQPTPPQAVFHQHYEMPFQTPPEFIAQIQAAANNWSNNEEVYGDENGHN